MCCFPAGLDRLLGLTQWVDLWLSWHSGWHKAVSWGADGGESLCMWRVPFSFLRWYQPPGPMVAVCAPEDFCSDLDRLSVSMLACLPHGAYCHLLTVEMNGELPQPLGSCHIGLWGKRSFSPLSGLMGRQQMPWKLSWGLFMAQSRWKKGKSQWIHHIITFINTLESLALN